MPGHKRATNEKPHRENARTLKRKREALDLKTLDQHVAELDSKAALTEFAQLPLSDPTADGLRGSHYKTLTDIQAKALPHALKGRDILGAAKTGSGKTLAFLVPVLENLYRNQWSDLDGLGALILSPTRELAIQTFEVLRKIGRYHTFSAGLVIGGKRLQDERERLGRMNILICTPGRMLQHMDQTATFDTNNLQMLVLDEADRIMDMGFQKTVDAVIEHLPKERQTMLFSATQTKRVSDLARLSLQDPEYISVHEEAPSATPASLQQNYIVVPLTEKLDTLWSFIRNNLKAKTLVFFSSGKQVRFVYEAFRHMRPGVPLLHLHGRQKLGARMDITHKFSSAKYSCLFSTDIAARGLDFPAVDWVIQVDCPEDTDTYIHRVGRTARYERNGRAVLFLEPSEEQGMVQRLASKKIPVERINVRSKKKQSIQGQLQNMCFKDPALKYLGQKAFVSYVKSIYVQKDKEIFKIKELPLEGFATALGLPGTPRIKFIKGEDTKSKKNAPRQLAHLSSDDESEAKENKKEVRTKYDRMFERRNQDVLTEHYNKLIRDENEPDGTGKNNPAEDADEDNDFLSVKRRFNAGDTELGGNDSEDEANKQDDNLPVRKIDLAGSQEPLVIDSKRREKLLQSKKKLLKYKGKGEKVVFDDDGNPHQIYELEGEDEFKKRGDPSEQRARFLELEKQRIHLADVRDKEIAKQKKREVKEKRRQHAREMRDAELRGSDDEGGPAEAMLVPPEEGEFPELSVSDRSDREEDESESEGEEEEKEEEEEAAPPQRKKQKRATDWAEESHAKTEKPPPRMETLEDLEALASGLLG